MRGGHSFRPPDRGGGLAEWPELCGQLASIVEYSNDAIFSRKFDGTITTWNAAAERIFGYTAGEVIGRATHFLLPRGKVDEFRSLMSRVRRGEVVQHFETERIRKDGGRIRVSITLSLICDSSRNPIGFSTIARDVSEQYAVREALARRERELDDFFEKSSVGLVLLSPAGFVLRPNSAFLELLERSARQVTSQPLEVFHPEPGVLRDLFRRIAARETLRNFPMEFLTARGKTRFVLVDADGFFERGSLIHSRWFIRDITRRRHLERELLESGDREKRRFAQEMHDGLGQQLGGIAYLSNVLWESLAERHAPEAGAASRIHDLVRKAIEDARRMARGLAPFRDAPEGLMEALHELAAETAELRGLRCQLLCTVPVLVPDAAIAGHLYRMAQEAVNNAVKHARARTVTLSLRTSNNRLRLLIADDGVGLGPLSPHRKGLGLRILQYRAGLLRGKLEIGPRQPRGTLVSCSVPMPANKETAT